MSGPSGQAADSAAPGWLVAAPAIFVLLWSTGFIGARLIVGDAEPLSFLAYRFAIVALVLAGWSLVVGAPWPSVRAALHAGVAGALIHGGYLGAVFWAIFYGMPAGVSALVVGLQPLMTAFLAVPFLGERIVWRHWLGLAVGIAGIGLVVWPKFSWGDFGITPATLAVTVAGTLSITAGSIYQKKFAANHDLRTGNVFQFIGAAAVVAIGAMLTESFQVIWSGPVVFAMVWLVLVLSIGAISLLYLMIRHGEVSKVAGLFYLVPALTAVIAWMLFDENLLLIQVIGMAVCAGAVMLVIRK